MDDLLAIIDNGYCIIIKCPDYEEIEDLERWIEDTYGMSCQWSIVYNVIDRRDCDVQVIEPYDDDDDE